MKGFTQEHLEAVAKRNMQLFINDRKNFESRMFWLGWKPSEIKQMTDFLERQVIK